MIISEGFLGALLALGSAISLAGNRSFASKPLVKSDPSFATYVTVLVGVPVAALAMFASNEEGTLLQVAPIALIIFATVGIFHFAIGRQTSYIAAKHIGANQSAPLISTQIVYSSLLAIALLGERVNTGIALGTVFILLGIFLLEVRSSAAKRGGNPKLGYVAAVATSIIFGISPLLIKVGFSTFNFYASSTFIAYATALIFFALTNSPLKISSGLKELPRYALVYFVIAGVLAAVGQLFRFAALTYAPVVVVIPILASHPIFTVMMTRKLAKDYEVFKLRTVGAVLFVVAGTVLVVLYSSAVAI